MSEPRTMSPARRALRSVAWGAVILSFPVWFAAFLVVPFLPLDGRSRVALAGLCIAAGEALFWSGGFVLGAEVIARFRPPKVNTGSSFRERRVVVVGATGGLGAAIARAVHREGGRAVLVGRDAAKLDALASELAAERVSLDVSDADAIARCAAEVCDAGDVHHVVYAAGVDVRKPLAAHSLRDVDDTLALDLRAPMLVAQAFLPRLAPGGCVALLGGFGDGRLALPYYTVDVAARAGLAGFCASVNRELALEGRDARVCFVCPAPADTDAERPYAALWASMGTTLVAPAKVADVVLAALVARRTHAIMGFGTRALSTLDALWPSLASVVVERAFGPALRRRFGTPTVDGDVSAAQGG
jgi:short-subunit dehydrogenase